MRALAVGLLGLGVALVYAAITGQSPLDELRKAVVTGRTDGRSGARPLTDPTASSTGQTIGTAVGTMGGAGRKPEPVNLTPIGQGSHRLAGAAHDAFKRWESYYGRTIPVTDSYRSWDAQNAAWQRDSERFAHPNSSAHVDGLAVDVNLSALGITVGRVGDAKYDRLYAAARQAGWCNYESGLRGHTWHFSFGGCR